jgi:hypothetical protein
MHVSFHARRLLVYMGWRGAEAQEVGNRGVIKE